MEIFVVKHETFRPELVNDSIILNIFDNHEAAIECINFYANNFVKACEDNYIGTYKNYKVNKQSSCIYIENTDNIAYCTVFSIQRWNINNKFYIKELV